MPPGAGNTMPNPPATITSTASVKPKSLTAGIARNSMYDIKKYITQMKHVWAKNNPRCSMAITLRMPVAMPCKKSAAFPTNPERSCCLASHQSSTHMATPNTPADTNVGKAGSCAASIKVKNASRLVTSAKATNPKSITKSTTRSVMTVPNSWSTGMSSVWFNAAQRATSPDRGTNAFAK